MNGWYIKRDDKKYGPYTSTQLVEMAKKGQVLPLDWVAQGEGEKWMPASQVKGLFAATSQATAAPPALPVAAPSTGLAASEPMRLGKKLLGAIPASVFRPVIGMFAVVSLGLLTSFFCGSLILFFLSLIHIAAAVVSIVLATRLRRFLYAPVAAVLTMTVWGWYCFSAIPLAISIPGLLAGIAVGVWSLFVFRSPDVKALFADAGKPGPLDRLGMPVLVGAAGGLLVVILGIGGVWHMVSGDKSKTNNARSGSGGKVDPGSDVKVDLPDFSKVDYSLDTTKLNYEQGPNGEKLMIGERPSRDGPEVVSGYKDKTGKFIEHGIWACKTRDGNPLFEIKMYQGKSHGKYTEFYPNGKVRKQGLMKEDEMHGKWVEFYETGGKKSESFYISGKAHGPYTEWFKTGKRKTELTYVNGEKHGVQTEWYENGKKAASTPNANGKLHGTLITWDENGEEIVRIRFRQGQPDFKPASEKREPFRRVIEVLRAGGAVEKLEDWMQVFGKPDAGYNEAAIPKRSDQPAARQVWVYNCRDGRIELRVRIVVGLGKLSRDQKGKARFTGVTVVSIDQTRDL